MPRLHLVRRIAVGGAAMILISPLLMGLSLHITLGGDVVQPTRLHELLIGPLQDSISGRSVRWILVRDGLVHETSGDARPRVDEDTPVVGAGLFATPGLIDMHVHRVPSWIPGHTGLEEALLLRHGVTTVRNLGPVFGGRFLSNPGRSNGRIVEVSCGRALTGPQAPSPFGVVVRSVAEVEGYVRDLARAGAPCVKIQSGFPASLLGDLSRLAREHGLDVVGHVPAGIPLTDPRIDDVQHACEPYCDRLRSSQIDDLENSFPRAGRCFTPALVEYAALAAIPLRLEEVRRSGLIPRIWWDVLWSPATLEALMPRTRADSDRRFRSAKRVVAALAVSESCIHVGTDQGQPGLVPGLAVHDEMRLLARSGLPLASIWEGVGPRAAEFLRWPERGRVRTSEPANILLFERDPYADLAALDSLAYVIARDELHDVEVLDDRIFRQVARLEGPAFERILEPALRRLVDEVRDRRAIHPERSR